MKVIVGSKNPNKITAVRETLKEYPEFKDAEVIGVEVDSGVSDQPKTFEETVKGAQTRAKNAFKDCDLSVGYESGLMKAPGTITGLLNCGVCVFYDGETFHMGLSPGFEYPPASMKLVEQGYDLSRAFKELKLTEHEYVGYSHGAIHILSHGKVDRIRLSKMGVHMALVPFLNKKLYQ